MEEKWHPSNLFSDSDGSLSELVSYIKTPINQRDVHDGTVIYV